ncbi:fascin domain-containing protein [Myxococcus faecalis]|uniref:fascin domain-containing protein n=1 Tax=Myxococcus faecalis TaxID=3115646 RepID=UPI003CFB662F
MHDSRTAFSSNGLPTIEPLGGQAIGQRASNGDDVVAEGGGGGTVNANRTAVGAWEQLIITFE